MTDRQAQYRKLKPEYDAFVIEQPERVSVLCIGDMNDPGNRSIVTSVGVWLLNDFFEPAPDNRVATITDYLDDRLGALNLPGDSAKSLALGIVQLLDLETGDNDV